MNTNGSPTRVFNFFAHGCSVLLERGRELENAEQTEEALGALMRALELQPDEPKVLLGLGEQLIRVGLHDESERPLRLAWEKDPNLLPAARLLVGVLLRQPDRFREAERVLRDARDLHPDDAGLKVVQGDLLVIKGHFEEARHLYNDVLDDYPDDEEAREGLVVALGREATRLVERGEAGKAAFLLKRAVDMAPDWAGLHVSLGKVYGRLGRLELAEECYRNAVELEPDNPDALLKLARVLRRLGGTHEAIEHLDAALAVDRDYLDARPDLAMALIDLGRMDDALALLLEELEHDPDCPVCHNNAALALMALERHDEARHHLQRAVNLDGDYFKAYYNLANSLAQLERHDEAKAAVEEMYRIDPETARIWTAESDLSEIEGDLGKN